MYIIVAPAPILSQCLRDIFHWSNKYVEWQFLVMAEALGSYREGSRKLSVRMFGESRVVDIEDGWSVLQLKKHLCTVSGRKLDELKIIFAGHVLADDLTLEVCGFP